jgi:hypothetical protein
MGSSAGAPSFFVLFFAPEANCNCSRHFAGVLHCCKLGPGDPFFLSAGLWKEFDARVCEKVTLVCHQFCRLFWRGEALMTGFIAQESDTGTSCGV